VAQDLDYEWEAYEKGWRGQPQQIKLTNEQLNGQIQQLTQQMINTQERLSIEMRNRETIQRRNLTGRKKKHIRGRKPKHAWCGASRALTPLDHCNNKIITIQQQLASYSKQIGQLNIQLNSNT